MRFYATRDIARGEALHFSYLSSDADFEERSQSTLTLTLTLTLP